MRSACCVPQFAEAPWKVQVDFSEEGLAMETHRRRADGRLSQ